MGNVEHTVDDNYILRLQLAKVHSERDSSLQQCIDFSVAKVEKLREDKKANPNNVTVLKALKREQTKVRCEDYIHLNREL